MAGDLLRKLGVGLALVSLPQLLIVGSEARVPLDPVPELASRQETTGFRLAPVESLAGLGLTPTCEQVLYQEIRCEAVVAGLSDRVWHGTLGDRAFTDSVCSAACGTALSVARRRITGACASTPELVPGYPVVALIDAVHTGWNETCLKDEETGDYCNEILDAFDDVEELSDMPRDQLCSYCYGGKLRLMQSSPYSAYDELHATTLEYINTECGVPDSPTEPLPDPISINGTQPERCSADRKYTTQEGDTCDSIATAQSVSGATLYYLNPTLSDCNKPAAGTELCLPLACATTYTVQEGESCVAVGVDQGVSWRSIVDWNAGLDARCSNLWSTNPFWGRVICVSAPGGPVERPPVNGTEPGNGGIGGPGGSGDGYGDTLVDPPAGATVAPGTTLRCGQFVQATGSEGCNVILARAGVPMGLFLDVNPSLGSSTECSANLVAGTWYCLHPLRSWNQTAAISQERTAFPVATAGNSSITSSSTDLGSTSVPSPVPTPASTTALARRARGLVSRQDGPVDPEAPEDCTFWDTAYNADQTCEYFEASWGISHEDFVSWNPSVLDDCSGLQIGNSYCVEVNYGIPSPPTTTSSSAAPPPPPTTTTTQAPAGPSPTQEGIVSDCSRWHQAVSGDSCFDIVNSYGTLSIEQFYAWNPAVGDNCQSLWLGYWYCIGVPGSGQVTPTTTTVPSPTNPPPTTTTVGCPGAPTPTQPGAVCSCKRWHMVGSGDSCWDIQNQYQITAQQFQNWNPQVGADCGTLWLGYYVCVGV